MTIINNNNSNSNRSNDNYYNRYSNNNSDNNNNKQPLTIIIAITITTIITIITTTNYHQLQLLLTYATVHYTSAPPLPLLTPLALISETLRLPLPDDSLPPHSSCSLPLVIKRRRSLARIALYALLTVVVNSDCC